MEVEADLYLVFTGWNTTNTESMTLGELMRWHSIAIKRHNQAKEEHKAGQT